MVGELLDVDLRIVLAREAVPPPRIGAVQLGRTTWLARPAERGDADDMRLRTIVGWRPEMAGVGGMSLLLTLEHGPRTQAVRQTRLDEGELVIGRSADADWQIDDPDMFVSRAHCRITGGPDGYFVTDTSSSGLFIDDADSPLGSRQLGPSSERHAVEAGRLHRMGRSADAGRSQPSAANQSVSERSPSGIASAGQHRPR